tara:strand:- start:330 stop:503 length:174 start_codon:yes stop_codon:yes gene_type:complete
MYKIEKREIALIAVTLNRFENSSFKSSLNKFFIKKCIAIEVGIHRIIEIIVPDKVNS